MKRHLQAFCKEHHETYEKALSHHAARHEIPKRRFPFSSLSMGYYKHKSVQFVVPHHERRPMLADNAKNE